MLPGVAFKPCWEEDSRGRRVLCHDWKSCLGKEWYSMGDIQYCRHQIEYILENIVEHQDGRYVTITETWPAEQRETGYNDTPVQHGFKSEADFARFRRITADVLFRLERTGMDGRLLLLEVKSGRMEFSREATNALNYIVGWRTKLMRYSLWKRQRKFLKKRKS